MTTYISQGVGGGSIHRGRIEQQRIMDRARKGKIEQMKASTSDRVEISEAARDLQKLDRLLRRAREVYDRLPDVRRERIEEVKTRLDQGFYDGKAVIKEAADILLESGIVS